MRHVLVGCIESLFRLEFHVWAHHHALATQDAGPPPQGSMLSPSPEMTACLHWLDRTIIPAALMQPQQDGNQPSHAMSPLSPPPRKPKVSASSQQLQDEAAKAGLAQEVRTSTPLPKPYSRPLPSRAVAHFSPPLAPSSDARVVGVHRCCACA